MADYYVTTGGSDAGGHTGEVGDPWASVSHACSLVSGVGDVIHVAAGSYTDNVQAVLAVGVKISGADKATTTINTTASPYIAATSNVPCVDGSNEISGITFNGGGTAALCLRSRARNNLKIHDCVFQNFTTEGVAIYGKYGYDDSTGAFQNAACAGGEPTATYCASGLQNLNVWPGTTDWATGVEVYSNTFTNCKLFPNTIQGALIHDNTINNGGTLGGVGNTGYFWSGVKFYNNSITLAANTASTIAIEIWCISDNTEFYNNVSNAWFSVLENEAGGNSPYSFQVRNNDFRSNLPASIGFALEIGFRLSDVLISGNIFGNTGANNTYQRCIMLANRGTQNNYYITRNIFLTTNGAPVELSSDPNAGQVSNHANIYFYNNVFDSSGSTNGILISCSNTAPAGTLSNIVVRNNYFNVGTRAVGFSPNPPTGTCSGNYYDHNMVATGKAHVQSGGDATFTIASNLTANGEFLATGDLWTNYYKPTPEGNLIDAGADVGLAYTGDAPDIGVFEEPPVGNVIATHRIGWRMA